MQVGGFNRGQELFAAHGWRAQRALHGLLDEFLAFDSTHRGSGKWVLFGLRAVFLCLDTWLLCFSDLSRCCRVLIVVLLCN